MGTEAVINAYAYKREAWRKSGYSHMCICEQKVSNFLELDKINKFKVIFDIHHRITSKFILRCYQLRKESLYRI